MLLKSTVSRMPKLTHIRAMVFSEELARSGLIRSFMTYNIRNRDFREAIFIIVAKGRADEYIRDNKPVLEANIAEFYEMQLAEAANSGYFLPATYHDFYTRIKNAGASPYAVYSGINPMTGQNRPAGDRMPQQTGFPYLSGGLPRDGTGNRVDFSGLAIFRDYTMVGVLDSDETRALSILLGKFKGSHIGLRDPLRPESNRVMLYIRALQPQITASLSNGQAGFVITVRLDANLEGVTSGISYEMPAYRPLLEQALATMFQEQLLAMLAHTQQLGSDPAGLGLHLRPLFADTAAMQQADIAELYRTAVIDVQVKASIRHSGRLWRTQSGS